MRRVDVGKDVIAVAVRLPGDGPDGRQTVKRMFKTFYGVLREAAGSRSLGRVQPRICLKNLNVCSISKRRRNACQVRSTASAVVAAPVVHSHSGPGLRSPGR